MTFSSAPKLFVTLATLLAIALLPVTTGINAANAGERYLIRFYSINDKAQERKLSMVRKADEPGCHDLSKFRKAYRVKVIGFASCQVFSEPGCTMNTRIEPWWQKKRGGDYETKNPNGEMSRGTRWVLSQDQTNASIRSWRCVMPNQG